MSEDSKIAATGHFDIPALAATLPDSATSLITDHYLTNREAASSRVIRMCKPTPPHYHATCDEYLYILAGRGTVWLGDPSQIRTFGPGDLLFFEKGTVHAMPAYTEEPVLILSVDTPRRDPMDIIFVNPGDGTAETFAARNVRLSSEA